MPPAMQAFANTQLDGLGLQARSYRKPIQLLQRQRTSSVHVQALMSVAGGAGQIRAQGWVRKQAGLDHVQRKRTVAETFGDTVMNVPDDDDDDDVLRWDPKTSTVVVVGCGPTGALMTHYLARRGYKVEVYDKGARPVEGDAASEPLVLKSRAGIAFDELGLTLASAGEVRGVPLRGAWTLGASEKERSLTPVDDSNIFTRSYFVDRSGLTAELVSAAEEKYADNVSFHWGTELKRVDLKKRYARFREVPISSATHSTAHSASSSSSSVPVGVSVQPASALSGTAASSLGKVGSSEQGTVTFNAPSTTTAPPSLGKSGISEKGVVSFYATNTAAPPSSASAPSPVPMPVPVPVPVAPRPTLAELFPAAGPVAKSLESLRFTGSSSAPAAPSTSQAEEDEETEGVQGEEVQYDLIIGADGANSTMRQLMAKAKVQDFNAMQPITDAQGYKTFSHLPPPTAEPVEGMAAHRPQEYMYCFQAPGRPTLTLIKGQSGTFHGTISGLQEWSNEQALASALRLSYPMLPANWATGIAMQVSDAAQPNVRTKSIVQVTQAYASRALLLGDAAHAVTGSMEQGPSANFESVRTLVLVMRGIQNNLEKIPEVYSAVRQEAVLSMQMMEFAARTGDADKAPLQYASWTITLSAALTKIYVSVAFAVGSLLNKLLPSTFLTAPQIIAKLDDRRVSYSETAKMVQSYGTPVFLVALAFMLYGLFKLYIAYG